MHKFCKTFLLVLSIIATLLVAILAMPYLAAPIYTFKAATPFEGKGYYNPYQKMDKKWFVANFHAHTKSWGGLTDGKNNQVEQVLKTYKQLGYHYIGISNYQKTTPIASDSSFISLPSYEHGINIKKRHHLCIGADRVVWTDCFFYQTIHHKQFIINKFQGSCDFLSVNHPSFCNGFNPQDFSLLSNYDAIEVFNHYRVSIPHWDSALSAGYYAVLMANDDMHRLDKMDELGTDFTVINGNNLDKKTLLESLRKGQHFGVRVKRKENENLAIKQQRIANLVKPVELSVTEGQLRIVLNQKVNSINFIGQHGRLKQQNRNDSVASYLFDDQDTYIRIELFDQDSNHLLFNPIVKTNDKQIVNDVRFQIDKTKTSLKYLTEILLLFILVYFFIRKKKNKDRLQRWIQSPYAKKTSLVVGGVLLLRICMAVVFELNNDELYYRVLSFFPNWSYFDHPPMMTWFINLFTFGMLFDHPFFIRLGALLLVIVNSFLIFDIGKKMGNEQVGFYSVLLFNFSPYVAVACGTFLIPDAGLLFFWLLSVRLACQLFITQTVNKNKILLLGLLIGFACLAKYSAIMLWFGIILFLLFYQPKWFKKWQLYASGLITAICCLPILVWNAKNNFISFVFHGDRISNLYSIGIKYFFEEIGGEFLYNNPVFYIFTFLALIAFIKARGYRKKSSSDWKMFYCIACPMILIFWGFSFFNRVLPHWSAPAFVTLIVPVAAFVVQKINARQKGYLTAVKVGIWSVVGVFFLFMIQFYTGFINHLPKDYTIELSSCKKTADAFMKYAAEQERMGEMPLKAPIVAPRWDVAARYEYHISRKQGRRVHTIGPLYNTHQYAWISQQRNNQHLHSDMWLITDNDFNYQPQNLLCSFSSFSKPDTLFIYRNKKVVKEVYVYKMKNIRSLLPYFY